MAKKELFDRRKEIFKKQGKKMIWVVGSSGNIGVAIIKLLKESNTPHFGTNSLFDIKNYRKLEEAVSTYSIPSMVINCVAATNVDWCEDNEKEAFHINALGVGNLAYLCKKYSAKLIHISTDYVFDGSMDEPRTEDGTVNPIQAYGRTKLSGEEIAIDNGAIVARVQWVLGHRNNYIKWIVDCLKNKKQCNLSTDQYGSPCSSDYLAKKILNMDRLVSGNIYHVTHDDYANRYETGIEVANYLGINPDGILIPTSNLNFGKAKRPLNTRLSNKKIRRHFDINESDSWRSDLRSYLSTL